MRYRTVPIVLSVLVALVAMACAPAAAPTPTPAPAKPAPVGTPPAAQPATAPAPAKPAPAPTAAAKPAPTAAPAKPAAPAAPKKTVKLKYGTSSVVGFSEVPAIAAFDAMKAENTGIEVEVVPFQTGDLGLKAMIGGQIDVGTARPEAILVANKAGADMRVFFTGKRNEWVLAAPTSIKTVKDLDGKRLARHAPNDLTSALAMYAAKKYNFKPNYLTVPGSEARVAALIQGQIDASPVDLAGVEALEKQKPGAFHVLLVFEKELPGIITANHYSSKREKIEADPETWQTLTTYLVRHFRRANQEPEWLANQAVKILPKADRAQMLATAKAYSQYGVFTTDGGVDKKNLEDMLNLLVDIDRIKKDDLLPFDRWAMSKFVEAANAKLGR